MLTSIKNGGKWIDYNFFSSETKHHPNGPTLISGKRGREEIAYGTV